MGVDAPVPLEQFTFAFGDIEFIVFKVILLYFLCHTVFALFHFLEKLCHRLRFAKKVWLYYLILTHITYVYSTLNEFYALA